MAKYTQDYRRIRIETPLGKDQLLLQRFRGQAGISQLFHYDLVMHSENGSLALEALIGKKATIQMARPDGSLRYINGLINSFWTAARIRVKT